MRVGRRFVIIGAVVLACFVALIVASYWFKWDWAGFANGEGNVTITSTSKGITTVKTLQPAKTLWDWLGLLAALAIPVVVGLGAAWFTAQQSKESDKENTDNQREAALQAYIDKMTELILREDLGNPLAKSHVLTIARARTATVLRILDPVRRGNLIRFLSQCELLTKCIEDDLIGIDLRRANLSRVNLRGVQLSKANLSNAILNFSDLSDAILREAKLSKAELIGTKLNGTKLSKAELIGTNLATADLIGADLGGAKFSRVSYLFSADLSEAYLLNVTGITNEELKKQAKSLKGATMPDGTTHP